MNSSPAIISRPLHWWIVLTAAMTLVLVGAGGLVTSHGVGMAVPDWPNTYGYNMFFFPFSRWVGGVLYEHTHRLIASTVGLMTTVMAIWLFGRKARPFLRSVGVAFLGIGVLTFAFGPAARRADAVVSLMTGAAALAASFFWPRCEATPKWLRRLGLAAFVLVVLQGVLGGLRVVLFKDQIGVFHATLAQLFFTLVCSLAVVTSQWWNDARTLLHSKNRIRECAEIPSQPEGRPLPPSEVRAPWLFIAGTALVLVQLILGATMRHQHAGLAIPDFPLAYGKLWPATDPSSVASYNQHRFEVVSANPITAFQIILQMVHRIMAVVILATITTCAWFYRRVKASERLIKVLVFTWLGLVLLQAGLGAATIWSNKAADIATAHVMVGALLLALGSILSMVSIRNSVMANQTNRSRNTLKADAPVLLSPRTAPAPGN